MKSGRSVLASCALAFGPTLAPSVGRAAPPPPAEIVRPGRGNFELPEIPPAEFAAVLLAETNRVRKAHRRSPLKAHVALDAAADDQAAFMALTLTAKHASPVAGQETPYDRVRRHGLEPVRVAENVASSPAGYGENRQSAQQIAALLVQQWMDSPGHRANILSRELTHLGGSVRLIWLPGDLWVAFGVQVFAVPRSSSSVLR
jgi:uncharacterized protein YkwD